MFSCKKNNNVLTKASTIKEYFSDSKENIEYNYIIENGDTILHGKSISRNEEGKVTAVGNYYRGHLKGKFTHYYNNGKIELIEYIKEDKNYGESVFYYDNGNIEKYILYNSDEDEISLIVDFDKNGRYLKHDGNPIAGWFYYNDDLSDLKIGDTLNFGYRIADIPTVKRTFTVKLLEDKKECSLLNSSEPASILLMEKITAKGRKTYRGSLKLEFNDSIRTVVKDSLDVVIR